MSALMNIIPEVVLLSTFPFIFYWFRGPVNWFKAAAAVFCVMAYVIVAAMYLLFAFGSGMSGGGAGSYPNERLLQPPLQVWIPTLLLPALIALLAVLRKGTVAFWTFAMGAGFTGFWAGLGWLPGSVEWQFVAAISAVGGACGLLAGITVALASRPRRGIGKVLSWTAAGACFAALGVLASEQGVERAARFNAKYRPEALEFTPFSVNPGIMLTVLGVEAFVWLALSTLAAGFTGYIEQGAMERAGGEMKRRRTYRDN